VQFPDLQSETGMDVNASLPYFLADDFLCTETSPITDIHVWGSWHNDMLPFGDPDLVIFTVVIHADIPADESPTGYSMPGEALAGWTFNPGDFIAQPWQEGTPEGWFDPPDYWEPVGDFTCWQYNFSINPVVAFIQQGTPDEPIVYWLAVQAMPLDPSAHFGWKTSLDHWNDDAVWAVGPATWGELIYPQGHPFEGESIDLAFVIENIGVDWGDAPDPPYPTLASSDGAWHLALPSTPAITSLGPLVDLELDGQPDGTATGDDLAGLDDEDGVVFATPLVPGETATVDVTRAGVFLGYLDAWVDFDGDGSWGPSEKIIVYTLLVPGLTSFDFGVPPDAVPGQTFARFRLAYNWGSPQSPVGGGYVGEVEDHEVFIEGGQEELDWGDAPDPTYPTLAASNGANHNIVPGFVLGALIDPEPDGQPHPAALGDDMTGLPDEDGVVFTSPVFVGQTATVDVIASAPGMLDAWVDVDSDGSWAGAGDQIYFAQPLVPGLNSLSFFVPAAVPTGQTFARFRFSANGGLPFDGPGGEGEVEDYEVYIEEEVQELDWGDADDPPYPTLAASNGASHVIEPGIFLGLTIDADPDGQPTGPADGDDLDGNDDEDGVVFTSPIIPGHVATVDVTASVAGGLDAWIDFEGDGSWVQASNQIFAGQPLVPGLNSLTFAVPGNAVSNLITTARFRFSMAGGLPYEGPAADGEVEDYVLLIDQAEFFKWVQFPDLEPTGIDVAAFEPFVLADDFLCTEPGRITVITLWGSWLWDEIPDPAAVQFTLSIHEDIPEDESPTGYSMPGELLWLKTFPPYEFAVDVWMDGIEEGWLEPPETYIFPADEVCWVYRFVIDPPEAFHQVGTPDEPIVYWLDVQALPEFSGAHFGWKTSLDHWNDDAVWGLGFEPYPGPWEELRYPPQHPWFPESIDLAFALNMDYGTDVPEGGEIVPERLGLYQNVPNPFNPTTTIAYDVPAGGSHVVIEVFDVNGRQVSTLIDEPQLEGRRSVSWHGVDESGRELPSGVYFYRMTAGEYAETRKMLLLK